MYRVPGKRKVVPFRQSQQEPLAKKQPGGCVLGTCTCPACCFPEQSLRGGDGGSGVQGGEEVSKLQGEGKGGVRGSMLATWSQLSEGSLHGYPTGHTQVSLSMLEAELPLLHENQLI